MSTASSERAILRSPVPADQDPRYLPRRPMRGRLESIQISDGGVPKGGVPGPIEVTVNGLLGDRQRDLRFHGGPDRAVCLFSHELIILLRSEGHPIDRGTTGENLTLSGLDWSLVQTGARMTVGEVTLEITKPVHPCRNIAGSFADGDFSRLSAKIYPGRSRLYARVLTPGLIRPGDPVTCVPGPLQASLQGSDA
jgi:MOSC domain-containing protein YiiM